jgi:tyrosinase-like protein
MSCRRDYRDLTAAERARFVAALYHVKANGVVDAFADEHGVHFSHGHNNSGFLPWHREFIRRFEAELETYDPRVRLPYWNSPADGATNSALWANDFLGQFDSAWNLNRSLGGGSLPSAEAVDGALGQSTYDAFWPDLESNVHNSPHGWVGGVMASSRSPGDPTFFLHHAWVDMLFAQWQLRHPGEPYVAGAGGPGFNDHIHPWMTTPADIWDHRVINLYSYPPTWTQDPPRVTPPPASPPTVSFVMVPEGLTFLRSAVFEADSCDPLTFNVGVPVVDPGAPAGTNFQRISGPSFVVDPHVDHTARIWLAYTGTTAGDMATGHVDVSCVETGDAWQVPIDAGTVPKPRAAIAMVLDQSNSMTLDSGVAPGVTRADVLRFSAPPSVGVVDDDHAMLVTTFDHDPHPQIGLTPADAAGRLQLQGAIAGYAPNPNGWTAIGEALQSAHDQLQPVTGYDIKATVLLTDGRENHGPHNRLWIDDVSGVITERTFAIGLGVPGEIDPARLMQLCDNREGYMLVTGALNQDALFRLATYYQQIIAGVTNHDIVLDPEGWVQPGTVVRIPFWIAETDILARAVLLTPQPWGLQFALETPAGDIVSQAMASPMVEWRGGPGLQMHRVSMPLPVGANDAHAGQWHVLLALGGRGGGLPTHALVGTGQGQQAARYSVMVQAYSNLTMAASLAQSSNEPGAALHLRASLREYDQPLTTPANVRAELTRPDGGVSVIAFGAVGEGAWETSLVATQVGVYRFRIMADGHTSRGRVFTRERLRTAAIWAGGDRPPRPPRHPVDPGDRLCKFLDCLLEQRGVSQLLERLGIDRGELLKCLSVICRDDGAPQAERPDAILKDRRLASELCQAVRSVEAPR